MSIKVPVDSLLRGLMSVDVKTKNTPPLLDVPLHPLRVVMMIWGVGGLDYDWVVGRVGEENDRWGKCHPHLHHQMLTMLERREDDVVVDFGFSPGRNNLPHHLG